MCGGKRGAIGATDRWILLRSTHPTIACLAPAHRLSVVASRAQRSRLCAKNTRRPSIGRHGKHRHVAVSPGENNSRRLVCTAATLLLRAPRSPGTGLDSILADVSAAHWSCSAIRKFKWGGRITVARPGTNREEQRADRRVVTPFHIVRLRFDSSPSPPSYSPQSQERELKWAPSVLTILASSPPPS